MTLAEWLKQMHAQYPDSNDYEKAISEYLKDRWATVYGAVAHDGVRISYRALVANAYDTGSMLYLDAKMYIVEHGTNYRQIINSKNYLAARFRIKPSDPAPVPITDESEIAFINLILAADDKGK